MRCIKAQILCLMFFVWNGRSFGFLSRSSNLNQWNRICIDRNNLQRVSQLFFANKIGTRSDDNVIGSSFEKDAIYLQKLREVSALIRTHDDIYYSNMIIEGVEQISDDEYDALVAEEAELCRNFPHLQKVLEDEVGLGDLTTRYGGRVGPILGLTETGGSSEMSKSNSLQRQEHLPMLSLENAMNEEQVIAWLKRVRKILNQSKKKSCSNDENDNLWINVTPKLDGLSLTLRYRQIISENICEDSGKKMYSLEWAATRGNGKIGEDVTDAAMAMNKSIPLTICLPVDGIDQLNSSEVADFFEIRGEVVSLRTNFVFITTFRVSRICTILDFASKGIFKIQRRIYR